MPSVHSGVGVDESARDCRFGGACARLRTIEEAGVQVVNLVHPARILVDFAEEGPICRR